MTSFSLTRRLNFLMKLAATSPLPLNYTQFGLEAESLPPTCWRGSVAMCALRSLVPPFLTILEELQSCNPVWDLPYVPCWNCKLIVSQLAKAVFQLLDGVKDSSTELQSKLAEIKGALSSGTNGLIDHLATGLAKFIGYEGSTIGNGGIAVGKHGTNSEPWKPNENRSGKRGYVYSYDPNMATLTFGGSNDTEAQKCAKIFLGCVPLCFYGLSYLYWKCSISYDKGGWQSLQLSGIDDLAYFMSGQGFKSSELNGMAGSGIVGTPYAKLQEFSTGFQEAKQAAQNRADKETKAKETLKIGKSFTPPSQADQKGKEVTSNNNPTYPEYLQALCGKWCNKPSTFTPSNDSSLSVLYYVSYLYFKGKQSALTNDPDFKPRPPSTIREMLYFLAALPFSPSYDSLNSYITEHFSKLVKNKSVSEDYELMVPVADSSSPNTNNTLSAADIKDYLITTCFYGPSILGTIQGKAGSENLSEPWLHELYSNGMKYKYLYGSGLFSTLSNYSYALQFQLYFLYTQCSSTYNLGRGWNQCQYGSGINTNSNTAVLSHICEGFKCNGASGCSHGGKGGNPIGNCNHHKKAQGCGENGNKSPLQAFLTDKLKGFSLSDKPDTNSPSHLDNHPPSSLCHVKMGFSGKLRPNPRKGNLISITLQSYCGSPTSPLRQLCGRLSCLTKRTPRTLGDVFGFLWHLNGQLFKNERPKLQGLIGKFDTALGINGSLSNTFTTDPYSVITTIWNHIAKRKYSIQAGSANATGLSLSLEAMAPAIPFLYQLFMAKDPNTLPGTLFDLTQHCHKWEVNQLKHESDAGSPSPKHQCSEPADLWSLYYPVYSDTQHAACRGKSCGGYLEPLTLSYGATFSPSAAPAYLSWMAYLTDDLNEQLSEMRDELNRISCKNCNSTFSCSKGQNGIISCSCPSVVSCAGVLPLLYRHGFQFHEAYSLKDTSTKRNCGQFSEQISNVLSANAPLTKLLESIDSFLYLFRFYFFYNLSSFWLCSLLILLYFIFYGIDVLHFKSHGHFPFSHTVPPIGLLTTGKAPALAKLTYYMP
ncbi:variant erythrocyte surface antigen-1 family protein [Babesia caballi]|uniref:Variant erythrocyte surface antigen-1 family protein n=1 Tax=Babesia caballi TaxID=5871 RepID=A0AAV4LND0_BABCB|nr:variant erythrocyte surface antigen-1 family protein [Babesia caballi]